MDTLKITKLIEEYLNSLEIYDIEIYKDEKNRKIHEYIIIGKGRDSDHIKLSLEHLLNFIKGKYNNSNISEIEEKSHNWFLLNIRTLIINLMTEEYRNRFTIEKSWNNIKKKIYFVRHGETDWNKIWLLQGSRDIPLNEKGIQQGIELSERLKKYKINHVYTSSLSRAYETGKIIAKSKNIECDILNNIKEIYFGYYEGKTKKELIDDIGEDKFHLLFHTNKMEDYQFKEGEKKLDVKNRFVEAVRNLMRNTKYENVLIVSHGFVLNSFLTSMGMTFGKVMGNCMIIRCDYENDQFSNFTILN